MEKIDKLDRQILEIISQNARIPFRDVAEQCGVSRAAIHQRVQRMIENDVITGSGYHVNPKVLGYASSAYIGVKLEKGSMYKNVIPEFDKIPEVTECYNISGSYDYLLKIHAPNMKYYQEFILNVLGTIDSLGSLESTFVMAEVKHQYGIHI